MELTILFFSWVLKDGALSLWAGAGALGWDWDQPVGLWLGELPALRTESGQEKKGIQYGRVSIDYELHFRVSLNWVY